MSCYLTSRIRRPHIPTLRALREAVAQETPASPSVWRCAPPMTINEWESLPPSLRRATGGAHRWQDGEGAP